MPFVVYSAQLKVIAITKFVSGQTIKAINKELITSISPRSFYRWKKLYDETQAVVRHPDTYEKRGRKTVYSDEDRDFMYELIDVDPTLFLDEVQAAMYAHTNRLACRQTIANDLKDRLFLTIHKVSAVDPNQSPELRGAYSARVCRLPPEYLVFLDECGLRAPDVQRKNVRSKKGERPKSLKRSRAGAHYSMLAAVCELGLLAVNSKINAYCRTDFEAFLKHVLLPVMKPYPNRNSVLVMDNAPIHRRGVIQALCSQVGVLLIYLPPYSPDFNPIEQVFKVFKDRLRRNGLFAHAINRFRCMEQTMSSVSKSLFITKLYQTCGYRKWSHIIV